MCFKLKSVLFSSIVLLFLSCSEATETVFPDIETTIDINPTKSSLSAFSDAWSAVDYLPLDATNPLIGTIKGIISTEEYYVVKSVNPTAVFLFDKTGKFIRQIGEEGIAPEQYEGIRAVCFDEARERVTLLDRNAMKLLHYDIQSKYISSQAIGFYANSFAMQKANYFLYVGAEMSDSSSSRVLVVDQESGTLVNEFLPIDPIQARYLNFFDRNNFTSFGDSLRFFYGFNDTIYHLEADDIQARYVIDFGKYNLPPSIFERSYASAYDFMTYIREADYAFRIIGYQENENYCLFAFEFREEFVWCIYDKADKTVRLFDQLEDDLILDGFQLDDLFVALPHALTADNKTISVVEAEVLKAYFKETNQAELGEELTASNNPILLIGTLK